MAEYRELSAFFAEYKTRVYKNTRAKMRQIAYDMAQTAKYNVIKNHSIDTGRLLYSIGSGTRDNGSKVEAYVYADAESDEGTKYAEFVEFGTGRYNEHGDGRQTPWRYQDADGEWHTTVGQHPKPFMRPAFAAHLGDLRKSMQAAIRIDGEKL